MEVDKIAKQTIQKMKIPKNKKILVALSGGKDSSVTAFLLNKFGYKIEGLYVDLCVGDYSKRCLNAVEELCKKLEIKLHVYNLEKEQGYSMKNVWAKTKKQNLNNCSACGIIKKWALNKKARELKFDFIATGHNLDDEAETFFINFLKGAPKLSLNSGFITCNIKDKKFVTRLKPLFYVSEEEVLKYAKKNQLPFISGKCPNAEESYRLEARKWIRQNIGTKEKMNLVKNMESLQRRVGKNKDSLISYCQTCGEPSRRDICKKCALFT